MDKVYAKEIADYCYPNHGILMGWVYPKDRPWVQAVTAYFYTEQSHKAKRFFLESGTGCVCIKEGAGRTVSAEYHPIRMINGTMIVSSGQESEAIYQSLLQGKGLYDSLRFFREREHWGLIPGHPFCTPRIFGFHQRNGDYALSILKKDSSSDIPQQNLYEFSGGNRFISTFQGSDCTKPFCGEPVAVGIKKQTASILAEQIWENLDPTARVSLFVRCIDQRNGFPETVIVNQFGKCSYSAPKTPIWPTRRNRK